MKITVWASQARLDALLTTEDATYLASVEKTRIKGWSGGNFWVNIQNISTNIIYIDTVNIDAVIWETRKIASGEDFNFVTTDLKNISLISDFAWSQCAITIV